MYATDFFITRAYFYGCLSALKTSEYPKHYMIIKNDNSSPSYSDKIEYDADGNGRNMAYSSKVAVEYKHHKVNACVTFLCPRNTISSRVSRGGSDGGGMRAPRKISRR